MDIGDDFLSESPDLDFDQAGADAGVSGALDGIGPGGAATPDAPPKSDDTWFTPQRMKALQSAASMNKNATADAGGSATPALPSAQMSQMQMAAQAPMQFHQMSPMQLQARPGQPIQRTAFAIGGALAPRHPVARMGAHMGAAMARPAGLSMAGPRLHLKTGGALDEAPGDGGGSAFGPAILAHLQNIKRGMGGASPEHQGALRTGLQKGPGNGRSDSIFTKAANGGNIATGDGEYVLPARTVAFWGEGSNDAGASAFDHLVKHTDHLIAHQAKHAKPPRRG